MVTEREQETKIALTSGGMIGEGRESLRGRETEERKSEVRTRNFRK